MCAAKRRACQRGSTVEQVICNHWVAGSIPVAGSMMRRQVRHVNVPGLLLHESRGLAAYWHRHHLCGRKREVAAVTSDYEGDVVAPPDLLCGHTACQREVRPRITKMIPIKVHMRSAAVDCDSSGEQKKSSRKLQVSELRF